ncbi:hypothetical protein [Mesorhizobium sp. M0814]|uniref:hypothetical protein n=1 Tax=unclassified Mesorhizobium TaxID=325217 RepID=UPI003336DFF6
MRAYWLIRIAALALNAAPAAGEPSVERGLYISIIGGCHDCHTEGYSESGGKIDPAKALKGNALGFQGPWGTSYAANLRLTAVDLTADGFVSYLRGLGTYPPMPGYNVRAMSDEDKKSLYLYIRTLGDAGERAPAFVPPRDKVHTPYIVLAPPLSPPACTRDFDCGVGEVCDPGGSGQCMKR